MFNCKPSGGTSIISGLYTWKMLASMNYHLNIKRLGEGGTQAFDLSILHNSLKKSKT
jgi:hypothetical protein